MAIRQSPVKSGRNVVIVDPRFSDYTHLLDAPVAREWNFHFLRTGAAAMRHAATAAGDFWIINAKLPDMCGFDLRRSIRQRLLKRPTLVIADHYDRQEELTAYKEQVTAYVVKPFDVAWLEERKEAQVRSSA